MTSCRMCENANFQYEEPDNHLVCICSFWREVAERNGCVGIGRISYLTQEKDCRGFREYKRDLLNCMGAENE